ncbi:MAG: leucine-rich repeat domain-containing protein [Bacteroidales bacterium]|nr:leucine-rich repeat domain-containing protein [Bacteroidales bacterium]
MKRVFFFAVSLFILFSCQAELDQLSVDSPDVLQPVSEESSVVFHASTESYSTPETKVYADEDMKVLWNADDRISIFNKTTYNYQYKFLGEDGDTAGDFGEVATSGFHTGGSVDYVYAVYPYRTSNKLNNQGVFTIVLPSEQTYKANSFGIGSNTMAAVSDGDFIAFKNVCGYLSISLWGNDVSVSKVTLQGKNGEKIAGKASVSMPLGGLPSTTMDGTATESITIECSPALKIGSSSSEPTTFWFAIPPVIFSGGITMTIEDDKGGVFTKSASVKIDIKRNTVDRMGTLQVIPKYAIVSFADDDFKAYCLDKFDDNQDGKITSEEASAVKSIDVCTDNIESLGGVESFTNLESLKCTGSGATATRSETEYNGQLTSLNVSALTKLKELDCRDNQLQTLDVSSNTGLETLICTENPMSEIKMAVGQEVPQLECPENTEIVHEWGDGIGPEKFPDEVFRDHVFVNYDTDGDGFLSDAECNAVRSIEVNTDNISSLEGISYFQNLWLLNCSGTLVDGNPTGQLTSLDVSNNTALTNLICDFNRITCLDVTKNTALRQLDLQFNKVADLDLSKNSSLTRIRCEFNQLTSLDLSNNPEMLVLTCHSNQLTNLDVSNNPKMTSIDCGDNKLTSLDVTNKPDLRRLDCDSNPITSLNLSDNLSLATLVCFENQLSDLDVSNNPDLGFLNCQENSLITLDVSNNPKLTKLYCYNPVMQYLYMAVGQEIDMINKKESTEIVRIIPIEDPVLLSYLQGSGFDSDGDGRIGESEALAIDAIKICNENVTSLKGIEFMPNLTVLECVQTSLQTVDISKNPLLTIVNFNSKYEPDPGTVISWSFHSGGSIRYTPQYKNNLTALDVSNNPKITWLDVIGNSITILDLSNNTALTDLDCENNRLTRLDVSSMPDLGWLNCAENELTELNVRNNPKLYELHCSRNNLGNLDLNNNPQLKTLECSDNALTVLDLSGNPALVNLQARSNQLSSLDVSSCPALYGIYASNNKLESIDISNNPNLKALDFSSNRVTSFDFAGSPNLETLRCGSNPLTDFDISSCTKLQELNCSGLQLDNLDLSKLTELTNLNCEQNDLTSLNLDANTKLTSLTVSYNQLESLTLSRCPSLKWFTCDNNLLRSLDVSGNPNLWTLNCSPMNDTNGNNLLTTIYVAAGQTINNLIKPEGTTVIEK